VPNSAILPELPFVKGPIFLDVLVSDCDVAIQPKCVRVQDVKKNQAIGKINNKAPRPASAFDPAFHLEQVTPAMSPKN